MNQICIHIPSLEDKHTIELEIKIDGKTRYMNYRVESVNWAEDGPSHEARIERLRRFVREYDEEWELVHIGMPDGSLIPVTFRQRR
jgi:hypothetical protein